MICQTFQRATRLPTSRARPASSSPKAGRTPSPCRLRQVIYRPARPSGGSDRRPGKRMNKGRRTLAIIACLSAILAAPASLAQTWPDRPIKIIAPFPAGGLVDVLARALGDEMAKSLHQPVIVENRPGAGGNVGAEFVARASPDGYTLLMTSPGIQSINQFLYKSMPFDPDKAFAPISMVADMSMVVVVHPKNGFSTLKQLVDFAHAHPGQLNFGSAGVGTTGHLGLELLMHSGAIRFTHVPYKGAAPSITDLIGGQ